MPDRLVHLTLAAERRRVSLYAAGSAFVRTVRCEAASAVDGAAHAQLSDEQACALVDGLAATTGYYPSPVDLGAQRERVVAMTDELRELREHTPPEGIESLGVPDTTTFDRYRTRHVGQSLADVAALLLADRELLTDHTVAELAAELGGVVDLLTGLHGQVTNPEDRLTTHAERIEQLRAELNETEVPA